MKFKTRKTWKNDSENQVVQPLRQYQPRSLKEVIQIVQEAEKHNLQVKAIGSGHSWSDVVVTTDCLVKPERLNKVLRLDTSLLNDSVDTSDLIHVESGLSIRDLNKELDSRGLALPNMGGYDAQTIIGAISTSTHGSGIELGPFDTIVASLELVSDGGTVYRIEPTDGITNQTEFNKKYPDRKLIQDDEWLNAAVVSMGCMGVIYSVILHVVKKFWLEEVRTLSTWEQVKRDLKKGDVLKNNRHYELYLDPYKKNGQHTCLVTVRNVTNEIQNLSPDKKNRNFFSEFLASIPFVRKIMNFVFRLEPKIAPDVIQGALEGLVDDGYTNVSYKVFHIGRASRITAISQEIGFPLKDDAYLAAIDRFLEMAEENRSLGKLYHNSPVTIRFVKASNAFLSMMHGYDTCMVEIILMKGTHGGFEMMQRYENELYKFSGRPHWGQLNTLTYDVIKSLYPEFDTWFGVYKKLNQNGTFSSPFTKRVGFSKEIVQQPLESTVSDATVTAATHA
ncbi:MAG: D-arabinono-1,4-lactone oxidase [bacterium]